MDEGKADMGMAERERVERDTDEIEDVTNVFEFLIPAGTVPADCSQFSLSYNKNVLDGWVRQPSACCGAASVAGAWNALAKLHRGDKMALTHESVLTVLPRHVCGDDSAQASLSDATAARPSQG